MPVSTVLLSYGVFVEFIDHQLDVESSHTTTEQKKRSSRSSSFVLVTKFEIIHQLNVAASVHLTVRG